jgi:hypothetical protein
MISAKRQAANERNAQKSTGPATAEGRDRAALDGSPDPSSDETVNKLLRLSRYEAAIERTYYRALRELKDLLKVRAKAQNDAVDAYIFGPIAGQSPVPGINMENTERTHSQPAKPAFEPQDLGLNDPEFQRFADRLAEIARVTG